MQTKIEREAISSNERAVTHGKHPCMQCERRHKADQKYTQSVTFHCVVVTVVLL